MSENELSRIIVGAAFRLHSIIGPGLLESAYETCLNYELIKSGLVVERQKPVPLVHEGIRLDCAYRLDMCVENKVIIELKAIEAINNSCIAQMLTYLRLTNLKLGLIINFNAPSLKTGIKRVINGHLEE